MHRDILGVHWVKQIDIAVAIMYVKFVYFRDEIVS